MFYPIKPLCGNLNLDGEVASDSIRVDARGVVSDALVGARPGQRIQDPL
jgi:hypothetical protein